MIPARVKWEVCDKLDQVNINERALFPGLDQLASWLTRYYAERRVPAERRVLPTRSERVRAVRRVQRRRSGRSAERGAS